MSRIWAVARHMIAEGIRMKSALVFMVIIVILLTVIPLTVAGDGVTVKSRAQSFLSYSLGSVGFLLSLLTGQSIFTLGLSLTCNRRITNRAVATHQTDVGIGRHQGQCTTIYKEYYS